MNYQNDLLDNRIEEPISIPRSPSTFDLASLSHETIRTFHKSRNRQSISFADVHHSECHGSENSQVLYMVGPSIKSRKSRGSLSSIGNRPTRIMDGTSDNKTDCEEDFVGDELTWNIIDREIFEWQYICRTGRPYWWSPESKNSRLKRLPGRLSNEPPPRSWMRDIDDHPKNDYNKRRRAISDSYLAGQDCIDDLARLVAIQLLGSCFTLPPDHNGLPAPDYSSYKLNGSPNSPDPRFISSLRMHTQFRYSPCFGHQARNPSPAQLWSGAYDGPSPSSCSPFTTAGFQTPDIGTSGSPPRRRRAHRALNVTEGSANSCSLDNQSEDYVKPAKKIHLDTTVSATEWYRRQGIDEGNAPPMTLPYLPNQSSGRRQRPNLVRTDSDMPESYRGVQSSSRSPKTNYRLQPVIRSEPHPVFVQPVKELVIKRWKTFRRRFGGSLNAPLPTDSEEYMSETSSPAHSELSSPAMSSDGKIRRRRARERGEIHSSSVDSTTHYNSPVSGYISPNVNEPPHPFWVDSAEASLASQLADPLAAAAALAETQHWSVQSSNSTSLNSPTPSDSVQREFPSAAAGHGRTQPIMAPTLSTPSYTSRIRKCHRRWSMLSEVHIPEDFAENITNGEASSVERSGLSTAGSALQSPDEEAEPNVLLAIRAGTGESIGNLGPMGAFSMRRMTVSSGSRPSLALRRTSTTGTQVFTPSDEGVEIDGLPAGPSKEVWNSRGNRRERTYL